jgi:hypothetical protein
MGQKPRIVEWLFSDKLRLLGAAGVMFAGWLAFEARWISDRHRAIDELQDQASFTVGTSSCCQMYVTASAVDPKTGLRVEIQENVWRPHRGIFGLSLQLFGEKRMEAIIYGPPRDTKLERRLRSLFPEAAIWLRRPRPDLYAPPVVRTDR